MPSCNYDEWKLATPFDHELECPACEFTCTVGDKECSECGHSFEPDFDPSDYGLD